MKTHSLLSRTPTLSSPSKSKPRSFSLLSKPPLLRHFRQLSTPTLILHLIFLLLQCFLLLSTKQTPLPSLPYFSHQQNQLPTTHDPFSMNCRSPPWVPLSSPCALRPSKRPRHSKPADQLYPSTSHKSQFKEDLELHDLIFYGRTQGTFIEMGALDGERYSNTWMFEKELNWEKGILIEGSPKNYRALSEKRRGCVRVNAAVCEGQGELHYVENDRDGGNRWTTEVGGFWEFFDEAYKKKHHSHLTDEMVVKFPTVRCTTMEEILDRFGVTHVDLWSLDVEKAEEVVLRSVNWSKFSASVILMEVKRGTSKNKQEVGERASRFLEEEVGYKKFRTITGGRNAVFAHPKFYEWLTEMYSEEDGKNVTR